VLYEHVAQSVCRLGYGMKDLASFPDRNNDGTTSRPVLGPTQLYLPIKRVWGGASLGG